MLDRADRLKRYIPTEHLWKCSVEIGFWRRWRPVITGWIECISHWYKDYVGENFIITPHWFYSSHFSEETGLQIWRWRHCRTVIMKVNFTFKIENKLVPLMGKASNRRICKGYSFTRMTGCWRR